MRFTIHKHLPFVSANIIWNQQNLRLDTVLLDTGSASTIFSADKLAEIGLLLEPDDVIRQIYGVGGSEFVFIKRVNRVWVGELAVVDFTIELGALDYGFTLNGIIGTDFLQQTNACIDFLASEIR